MLRVIVIHNFIINSTFFMHENILIAGAGISGLSVATLLTEAGYKVKIVSSSFSPNITSDRAAAFWFPYHISHQKKCISWCLESYQKYEKLSHIPSSGISMVKLIKVLRKVADEKEPVWKLFMPEGTCIEMAKEDFPPGDYLTCYEIIVPLIETQIFLPYLKNKLLENGVVFETRQINNIETLSAEAKVVVNCTGLGSRELCSDTQLIPVKGQVALLSPVEKMDIFLDNEKPLYIVPRRDAIIVGGTYEENIFTETTDENVLEKILQNAYEVFPALKNQQRIGSWAGLRPYRREVRVERESGTNIIHNYGHGGSGFTLAFGSAGVVKKIIETWEN